MSTAPKRTRAGQGEAAGITENKRTGEKTALPIRNTSYTPRETDGTSVEVELGFTENLGEFNFGKVHVRVSMPTTAARIREAGDAAFEAADSMLSDYREEFIKG
jgi:hypothetical protein